MSDCLYMPGPLTGLCCRCGLLEKAHAPTPSLAPDPFAAWCALSDDRRRWLVEDMRQRAAHLDEDAAEDTREETVAELLELSGDYTVAADALEALAAGRRP